MTFYLEILVMIAKRLINNYGLPIFKRYITSNKGNYKTILNSYFIVNLGG